MKSKNINSLIINSAKANQDAATKYKKALENILDELRVNPKLSLVMRIKEIAEEGLGL